MLNNEPYIYQTIHTTSHFPLHVEEHVRVLERAFMAIFFRPLYIDIEELRNTIITLLRSERCPLSLSTFVEVRVDGDGTSSVILGEHSLYEGYALRCITPTAKIVTFTSPFTLYPSSVRRATVEFANRVAQNLGGELAVECDERSRVLSIGGDPPFAISKRRLYTTPTIDSVERAVVIDAAHRCGLEVIEGDISRYELPHFDELFLCNHYGITAISRCERRLYMSILAERIAEAMGQPW